MRDIKARAGGSTSLGRKRQRPLPLSNTHNTSPEAITRENCQNHSKPAQLELEEG